MRTHRFEGRFKSTAHARRIRFNGPVWAADPECGGANADTLNASGRHAFTSACSVVTLPETNASFDYAIWISCQMVDYDCPECTPNTPSPVRRGGGEGYEYKSGDYLFIIVVIILLLVCCVCGCMCGVAACIGACAAAGAHEAGRLIPISDADVPGLGKGATFLWAPIGTTVRQPIFVPADAAPPMGAAPADSMSLQQAWPASAQRQY